MNDEGPIKATTTILPPSNARLRLIARHALHARLGILHDAAERYAEDVPALLAALREAQAAARVAQRSIRIEERLRLR